MTQKASSFALTPEPPYYAVIFTSQRKEGDRGYAQMADDMVQLAAKQPGFLGMETVRDADGFGITISYWTTLEAITSWKRDSEHQAAQEGGKSLWYSNYHVRISQVQRAYSKSYKA